jgi:hypothetical protein
VAIAYTELTNKETPGEKTVYNILKSRLDDDYMMWHNHIISPINREIDFIVLNPFYGIWVIEVKDWAIDQIVSTEGQNIELKKGTKTVLTKNPIYQSRDAWVAIKDKIGKISILNHKDGPHMGKPLLPINSLVIFTNILQSDLKEKGLSGIFHDFVTVTRDLIESHVDDQEWQEAFNYKRSIRFIINNGLNIEQINEIKSVIGNVTVKDSSTEESVGTLDFTQERLVKWKTKGQAVIEGPAGSGKSIVLIKRAIHIKEKNPDWDICVICFNAVMGNYLRILFSDEGIESEIDVYDVYQWCHQVGLPGIKNYYSQTKEGPEDALRMALSDGVRKEYDAILVDEGQDTTNIYLSLYRKMLKDDNSSFTIFYDLKQTLYTEKNIIQLLKNNGFEVPKQRRLVKQQRSVLIATAITYFEKYNNPNVSLEEIYKNVSILLEDMFSDPIGVLARGVKGSYQAVKNLFSNRKNNIMVELKKSIELKQFDSIVDMITSYCEIINNEINDEKFNYGDFLLIYPSRKIVDIGNNESGEIISLIENAMEENDIPFELIDRLPHDNRRNSDLREDVVRGMTMHASKGFDSKITFICGFDGIDLRKKDHPAELGYVALTRAKEKCYVGYQQLTESVDHLKKTIEYIEKA